MLTLSDLHAVLGDNQCVYYRYIFSSIVIITELQTA